MLTVEDDGTSTENIGWLGKLAFKGPRGWAQQIYIHSVLVRELLGAVDGSDDSVGVALEASRERDGSVDGNGEDVAAEAGEDDEALALAGLQREAGGGERERTMSVTERWTAEKYQPERPTATLTVANLR